MVAVMILHIRSKYTAVGRKEIVTFFYLYSVVELLSIFLDSGIIPSSSNIYAVRLHLLPALAEAAVRRAAMATGDARADLERPSPLCSGSPRSISASSAPHSGACS